MLVDTSRKCCCNLSIIEELSANVYIKEDGHKIILHEHEKLD